SCLCSKYGGPGLSMACNTQFKVIGPDHPVMATAGEDIVLPCHLSPRVSAENMEVRWYRSQFYSLVHLYRDGDNQNERQMPEYHGRTEFLRDDIANGSVALRIRHVRPSDEGQYRCFFRSSVFHEESLLELKVAGLGSAPLISVEGYQDGGIRMVCRSAGWYPEPEVLWRDPSGEPLTSLSETKPRGANGLFETQSSIIITETSNQSLSCHIRNALLNQEKESTVYIAEIGKLFTVTGPDRPIAASLGGEAVLSCHLSPRMSAETMEVRWFRSQYSPVVHLYCDGQDQYRQQMPEYGGRTELSKDDLTNGRVSLRIRDIRPSDDGQYTCLFQSGDSSEEALLELQVAGLGSAPGISVEGHQDRGIRVVCRSPGWYPQPEAQWRDLQGQLLPSASENISREADGLFQAEIAIVLTEESNQKVSCCVRSPRLDQERESAISIAGQCPSVPHMDGLRRCRRGQRVFIIVSPMYGPGPSRC
uniref:Ig-like domain-containing protein n=1 Tax=Terrapene triunguis TaxID=2587831 RepID=A0A674J1T3_9SAUR